MKTILLISRCPPYPIHLGDRLIIWHLCRHLAARGYTIDLLAFTDRDDDYRQIDAYRPYFRHIRLVAEPRRNYLSRLVRRFPRQAHDAWSPTMWAAVRAWVAQHDYDLAHLFGGVQVYEYAGALGALPALITPYESYSLYLSRLVASLPRFRPAWWRAVVRRGIAAHYEAWMFTPYRRVVVVADRDRDELHRINPALPLAVIPNGIDLDYFQPPATPREADTLLFTGNYEYAPNVDAALWLAREVLPAVRAQIPGARLWLVGHAPPPEMQALAGDGIEVTGAVPDVRPYLARATVFASGLRLGAGIKNKVLEALALGCPVVATPLSMDGIAARDGHEARIAPPEQFAAAVIALLRDPAQRDSLARNGRILIEERYSWSHTADLYERLYAAL